MIPVEGHKNLFRDENSGAIVNCDTVSYSEYIKMKRTKQKHREELDEIKKDIVQIKEMLKELLNGPK